MTIHPDHNWYVTKLVAAHRKQQPALRDMLHRNLRDMSKYHRNLILQDARQEIIAAK